MLEGQDVSIINNTFNMGYAHSIQLGIKYAYKKNYDYGVLFDGDNQHIASYVKDLLNEAIKTKADIVIGSRYLNKGYKQYFFRLLGTKLFSILIKLFCHQKIADPLSGMQCLNKKAMNYYSTMENFPNYVDANLIIDLLLKNYKIKEVPVKMRQRESGISMHSGILKPIRYMFSMLYIIVITILLNIRKD